jgi:hypothetical protein
VRAGSLRAGSDILDIRPFIVDLPLRDPLEASPDGGHTDFPFTVIAQL